MSTSDRPARVAVAEFAPSRTVYPAPRPANRPGRANPGLRLAAAIDRAVADLTTATAADELVAGLAWTAAVGETCVLTASVTDVRAAVAALRSGDLVGAATALEAARADLPEL